MNLPGKLVLVSIFNLAFAATALADGYTCDNTAKLSTCTELPADSQTLKEMGSPEKYGQFCARFGGKWSAGAVCAKEGRLATCSGARFKKYVYSAAKLAHEEQSCKQPGKDKYVWTPAK